jgi:hypothetical protein
MTVLLITIRNEDNHKTKQSRSFLIVREDKPYASRRPSTILAAGQESNSWKVIDRLVRYGFALEFWASTSTCPESNSLLFLASCQLHLAPGGYSWADLVRCYLVYSIDIGSGPKKQGRRGLEDGMEGLPSGSVGLPNPDIAQSLTRLPNAP